MGRKTVAFLTVSVHWFQWHNVSNPRCLRVSLQRLLNVSVAVAIWFVKASLSELGPKKVLVTVLLGFEKSKMCLCAGPDAVEAQCQRLQIRNKDGDQVLFSAGEDELLMTTEKFTVTGKLGQLQRQRRTYQRNLRHSNKKKVLNIFTRFRGRCFRTFCGNTTDPGEIFWRPEVSVWVIRNPSKA